MNVASFGYYVRTVPSLPATRAKKDRISEAGFGFWVPIYVVPNNRDTQQGGQGTVPQTRPLIIVIQVNAQWYCYARSGKAFSDPPY